MKTLECVHKKNFFFPIFSVDTTAVFNLFVTRNTRTICKDTTCKILQRSSIFFFQARDSYFLDSGDKIRYFFEVNNNTMLSYEENKKKLKTDAFNEAGELQLDKHSSLNKIGHALHYLNPVFRQDQHHF